MHLYLFKRMDKDGEDDTYRKYFPRVLYDIKR